MASYEFVLAALAILGIAISKTVATDYLVGDSTGCTLNFDYQEWALGKQFYVGDTITFKYPVGYHNVVKTDKADFKQCTAPANSPALKSGNSVIELLTPGTKWYICSVGTHCALGNMKLAIKVWDQTEFAPAPTPTSGDSWD